MVRVQMTAAISGTRNGAQWPPPGGEIDLPEDEAADMIRSFLAQPVPEEAPEEVAPEEVAVEPEAPEEAAIIEEPTERATKPKTVTRAKRRK